MGSLISRNNAECSGITSLLVLALVISIIGWVLIGTIILAGIGLIFQIIATALFLIAFILCMWKIFKSYKNHTNLTGWCKLNICICIIAFIIVLAGVIQGSIGYSNNLHDPLITPIPTPTVEVGN